MYFPHIYLHNNCYVLRDQVLVNVLLELLYPAPGGHNIHLTLGTVINISRSAQILTYFFVIFDRAYKECLYSFW